MGVGLYFLKMPVNLSQYRRKIVLFNSSSIVNSSKVNNFNTSNYRSNTYIAFFLTSVNKIIIPSVFIIFFFSLLVSLSGVAEVNPGPNCKPNETLSICHWNLNSISVHNFAKLRLLKAYVAVHEFDIICLSETLLVFHLIIS